MAGVSVISSHTSSAENPWTSRKVIASRCRSGRVAIAEVTTSARSASMTASSGSGHAIGKTFQPPVYWSSGPRNRSGSTVGPRELNGTARRSRVPRVRAMLVRIRNVQVRSDERPSNPSIPRSTASQAS